MPENCLLSSLPSCQPDCLPSWSPSCPHARLRLCLQGHLFSGQPAPDLPESLHICPPNWKPACLHACPVICPSCCTLARLSTCPPAWPCVCHLSVYLPVNLIAHPITRSPAHRPGRTLACTSAHLPTCFAHTGLSSAWTVNNQPDVTCQSYSLIGCYDSPSSFHRSPGWWDLFRSILLPIRGIRANMRFSAWHEFLPSFRVESSHQFQLNFPPIYWTRAMLAWTDSMYSHRNDYAGSTSSVMLNMTTLLGLKIW